MSLRTRALVTGARHGAAGTAALLAVLLGGCAVGGRHAPPDTSLPARFAHADPQASSMAVATRDGAWWARFGDPALDSVVAEVLARNHDLAAAGLVLQRARLQAGLTRAERLPRPSAGLDARISRDEERSQRSAGASLGVSWEADLFGRLGAAADAAAWEAAATAADREATALALVATTIETWAELALLDTRIAMGEQSLAHARRTLQLVESQYRAGAVSGLEPAEARQNVASQAAAQRGFLQQRVALEATLALLLGRARLDPSPRPASLAEWRLPPIAAGVPAELVAHRPDLRAAEHRIRAAMADVDAARASFYPRLTLTGSLGSGADGFSRVFADPVLALAASLALPFIDWRRMQLSLRVSETVFAQQLLAFRQLLLNAYQEVDTALAEAAALEERHALAATTLAAAREVERINEVRYRAGATPLRSWLDAQERRRDAELALAQLTVDRVRNRVLLFRALGAPLPEAGRTAAPD